MVTNRETGEPAWSPMGSTANIAGRVLASDICGKNKEYAGVLGTGVAKLPGGINAGRTGLTETAAKAAGYDVITALSGVDDKAQYCPCLLYASPEQELTYEFSQQFTLEAAANHGNAVPVRVSFTDNAGHTESLEAVSYTHLNTEDRRFLKFF